MEYVIEMNHITKQFGSFKANDDITLTCGGDSCYSTPPAAADGARNQDEMINKRYDPLGP